MRIAVLFDNLGPYHIARLNQLGALCDLLVIENNATSSEYQWQSTEVVPFRRITLFHSVGSSNSKSGKEVYRAVGDSLSEFNPEIVVVPGWATKQAISAMLWARIHCVPIIVMSDSQEIDFPRKAYSERIKKLIISCCAGALVAGSSHREYIVKLGMQGDRVRIGYDVVDNDYFYNGAIEAKKNSDSLKEIYNLPEHFFLTCARFVEKKNIPSLISAFLIFLRNNDANFSLREKWNLIILGDGPMRNILEKQIDEFGLTGRVLMPGFKQYPELPTYYGLAEAFILPSTTEQWGLVVNEAMASGLPVLVSNRCGAAVELVKKDVNGFSFDPNNVTELSGFMLQMAENETIRRKMGEESTRIIKNWTPAMFADNLIELAELVKLAPKMKTTWFINILLKAMLYRTLVVNS